MMLLAPVTRRGAQASSQNIREGCSAPLTAARGLTPSPMLALSQLLTSTAQCGFVTVLLAPDLGKRNSC